VRALMLTLGLFLATGSVSIAAAQNTSDSDPVRIASAEVPVASDAIPDWAQRFSTPDSNESYDVVSGRLKTDVKLQTSNPRWNVNLGLTSRDGNLGQPREEMWAGATYNITSRLSIGGSVGVGGEDLGPGAEWGEQRLETGIRLQSAFKF